MKIRLIIFLVIFSFTNYSYAQKVSIRKWVSHNVDSLKKIRVDTIEYYHQYCGECYIRNPPGVHRNHCETEDSWTQVVNIILYQQQGKYHSLTFNCLGPSIKQDINAANSLTYFISIIPTLNNRDRAIKALIKRRKFLAPIFVDGTYEEADIYLNNKKQHAYMQIDERTDKTWRSFFWIDKETKLFKLITVDIN